MNRYLLHVEEHVSRVYVVNANNETDALEAFKRGDFIDDWTDETTIERITDVRLSGETISHYS